MKKTYKLATIALGITMLFSLTACNQTNMTGFKPTSVTVTDPKVEIKKGDTLAWIYTDYGIIKAKLYTNETPNTAKNFIELANQGKFTDVPVHRVVKDFVIQTGDFERGNGTGGYTYKGPGTKMDDEINPSLTHSFGALSMANAGPNTNGSQFFIVTNSNGAKFLDGNYSIFGQVYEGMSTAVTIQNLEKGNTQMPSEPVFMKKVEIKTAE